eukprot:718822_1
MTQEKGKSLPHLKLGRLNQLSPAKKLISSVRQSHSHPNNYAVKSPRLASSYRSPRKSLRQNWYKILAKQAQDIENENGITLPNFASTSEGTSGSPRDISSSPRDLEKSSFTSDVAKQIESTRGYNDSQKRRPFSDVVYSLEHLEKVWLSETDGVNETQFIELLEPILGCSSEALSILFQKMDANADGTLDWDEYISYLLREASHNWENSVAMGQCLLKETDPNPNFAFSAMIQDIRVVSEDSSGIASSGKYVITLADNTVQVWNSSSLTYECNVPVHSRIEQPNGLMPHSRKGSQSYDSEGDIASSMKKNLIFPVTTVLPYESRFSSNAQLIISSMDRSVNFFVPSKSVLTSESSRRSQPKIKYSLESGFYCLETPQCMDLCDLPTTYNNVLLTIGSTSGSVSAYDIAKSNELRGKSQLHDSGAGIRRLKFIPTIGLVSSGMDSKICISDVEKWKKLRTLSGHRRGVYAFDYSPSHKLLASCSYDRKILLWDPYISRHTGSLRGHHSTVVDILMNEKNNQIITASSDKKIKIWDIRTLRCIQSFTDGCQHSPEDVLTAITFDKDHSKLISAGSMVRFWPVQTSSESRSKSGLYGNNNLIVALCYSHIFKQIICVTVDESVTLFSIYSGKSVFEFSTDHGFPLTAACLDQRGKRLLTAAHNGTVKLWNFNNGGLMWEFSRMPKEIICLLFLPRSLNSVVGIGCENVVVRWPDPSAPKQASILEQQGHESDVLSVTFHESMLVSGSSDGEIIVWYVDSASIKKRLLIPGKDGVSQVYFIKLSDSLLLICGCVSGSLYVYDTHRWSCIRTEQAVMTEEILCLVSDSNQQRLCVTDCEVSAKLFDIREIDEPDGTMILIKDWKPHDNSRLTSCIFCDQGNIFVTGSESGEIKLWTCEGELCAKIGQSNIWPIKRPSSKGGDISEESSFEEHNILTESADPNKKVQKKTYAEAHPIFVPNTLEKFGLRTASFTNTQFRSNSKKSTEDGIGLHNMKLLSKLA